MHFDVGPYPYRVDITDGQLHDPEGRPADALIHGDRGLIQIAGTVAPGQRTRKLLHELAHAYCWHFPPPIPGGEEWCDWFSTVTDAIIGQLMRQGGPAALMALELDTFLNFKPDAFTGSLADSGTERMLSCAMCQQRIAPGSVLITRPTAHPSNAAPIVGLAFYCPFCDHVQHWTEFVNAAGRPTGVCALEPEYFGGDEAEQFCQQFPEKTDIHPAS